MLLDSNMDAVDEYGVHNRSMRGAAGEEVGQNSRRKQIFRLPWWRGKGDERAAVAAAMEERVKEHSEFRVSQGGSHVHWGGALNGKGRNRRGQQKLQCIGRRSDLQSSQMETILHVMQKLVREELSSLSSGARCDCMTSSSLKIYPADPTSCAGDGRMRSSYLQTDQDAIQTFGGDGDRHIAEHHGSHWMTTNGGKVVAYPVTRDTAELEQMLDMECRRCLFMTFVMASGLRLLGDRSCWPLLELFLVPWMPIHSHRHGRNTIPRWRRWSHMALKIGVALSTRFCSSFLGPFLTAHAVLSLGSFRPINASTGQRCLSVNKRLMGTAVLPHSAPRSQGAPHLQVLDKHSEQDSEPPSAEMLKVQQIDTVKSHPVSHASDDEDCSLVLENEPPSLTRHDYACVLRSQDEARNTYQEKQDDIVAQGLIEDISQERQIVDSRCTTSHPNLPAMQEGLQLCTLGDSSLEVWAPALGPGYETVPPLTTDGHSLDHDMVSVPSLVDEMLSDGPSHGEVIKDVGSSPCLDRLPLTETSKPPGDLSAGSRMKSEAKACPVNGSTVLDGSVSRENWLSSSLECTDPLRFSASQPGATHACTQGEHMVTSQSLHPCVHLDPDEQDSPHSNQRFGCAPQTQGTASLDHGRQHEGTEHVVSSLAVPLNGKGTWAESQTDQLLDIPTSAAVAHQIVCPFDSSVSSEKGPCALSECESNMQPSVAAVHDVCRDTIGRSENFAHTVIRNTMVMTGTATEADWLQPGAEMDKTDVPTSTRVSAKWSDFVSPECPQTYEADTASLTSSTSSSSLGFTDSEDEMVHSGDPLRSMQSAEAPECQVAGDTFTESPVDETKDPRATDAQRLPGRQQSELALVAKLGGPAETAHITVKARNAVKAGQIVFSHSDHPICVAMRNRRHTNGDQKYLKLSDLQAPPWGDLVFWHGLCREGRPTLCVLLGKAVCTLPSSLLGSLITVIVSHMELAEVNLFGGSSQQMNLLLDLSGLGLLRMPPMDILQRLGTVINRDYAGRGGSVYVLNAPVMLSIVVSAIKGVILRPSYNKGAMIEKGFLDSKESILVLGRRSTQLLEKHFQAPMVHSIFGGRCSCGKDSRPCSVGYNFLATR